MIRKSLLALVCAALGLLPLAAASENDERLIDRYTTLAGSKQNAKSLVTGLREGKKVKLTRGGGSETFTPPTGKMEYGNVDITLALAEASLKEKRISQPAPVQLRTTVVEILKMRNDGKDWGEIAKTHGYKFAEAKRAAKPAAEPKRVDKPAQVKRGDKPRSPALVPAADFGYSSPRLGNR